VTVRGSGWIPLDYTHCTVLCALAATTGRVVSSRTPQPAAQEPRKIEGGMSAGVAERTDTAAPGCPAAPQFVGVALYYKLTCSSYLPLHRSPTMRDRPESVPENLTKVRVVPGLPSLLIAFGLVMVAPALTFADDRPCGPEGLPPALRALVPQGFRGADFRPACRKHDQCYVYGESKKSCDRQFLNQLKNACGSSARPRACRRRVRRMYVAVRLFGRRAYRASRP
jgi:hypothetical protein